MIGSERSLMFYRETNIHPVCECSRGLSMLGTISALWQKKQTNPDHCWKLKTHSEDGGTTEKWNGQEKN